MGKCRNRSKKEIQKRMSMRKSKNQATRKANWRKKLWNLWLLTKFCSRVFYPYPYRRPFLFWRPRFPNHPYLRFTPLSCQFQSLIHWILCSNCMNKNRNTSSIWKSTRKKCIITKWREVRTWLRKKKGRPNFRMPNAKFAQMEIIPMTTLLCFVRRVTLVCIKDVWVWPKCLPKVGFVMSVWHLDLRELIFHARYAMFEVEPWNAPTFILIQTCLSKLILPTTNTQSVALTTSKSKNICIQPSTPTNQSKSCTMITLTSHRTQRNSQVAIMCGYIMFVRFGYLNVTLNRKMAP